MHPVFSKQVERKDVKSFNIKKITPWRFAFSRRDFCLCNINLFLINQNGDKDCGKLRGKCGKLLAVEGGFYGVS